MTKNRMAELRRKLNKLIIELDRLEIALDSPASGMTLGRYEQEREKLLDGFMQAIAATLGKNDETTLLPCPFCGGEVEMVREGSSWIYCERCHIRVIGAGMRDDSVAEAWNTRVEHTCERFWTGAEMICSACAHQLNSKTANFCPNCGRKVVEHG